MHSQVELGKKRKSVFIEVQIIAEQLRFGS
jgi:hypothetical protein